MRKISQLFLLYSLLILMPCIIKSQALVNFDTDKGLSQRWVRCIHQYQFGFVWFGTKDGLNRYDGYECRIYRPENTFNKLPSASINNFYEEEGNIWICTSGGICRYNISKDNFQVFPFIKDIEVNCMIKSGSGIYWFGTQQGLYMFDPADSITRYFRHEASHNSSLSNDQVTALLEDSKKNLWVGTLSGLNIFVTGQNSFIHVKDYKNKYPYATVHVRDILEDANGLIWAGIYSGGVDIIEEKDKNHNL